MSAAGTSVLRDYYDDNDRALSIRKTKATTRAKPPLIADREKRDAAKARDTAKASSKAPITATTGTSQAIIAAGRRAAAREGHFSNYSRAERARIK